MKKNSRKLAPKKRIPDGGNYKKPGSQFFNAAIQPKLRISQPKDTFEQEADAMAEKVMRMPANENMFFRPPVNLFQRKCEQCEEEDKQMQRKENSSQPVEARSSSVSSYINSLSSKGSPLPDESKFFFGQRFGYDFSNVKIHNDVDAVRSSQSINALAYTVGNNIVFNQNQFSPESDDGRKLLAHELTHTIQQSRNQDSNTSFDSNFQIFRQACEEFPGGSTDCVVDEKTGTPTGKVKSTVTETNPCTRTCVQKHEAIHVKQFKKYCPELRDCYLAADKGKRPAEDCGKMAIFGGNEKECPAYNVSLQCVEDRLKHSKHCKSKKNREYGRRKLESEKCFHKKYCGS